jgi:peptidoglycan hydrolase-like protein with peptidoglycan-binding domain
MLMPGTSFAEGDSGDRAASSATVLRSGGLLVRGEGYGVVNGSRAVRALQLRLRAGGFRPGPIDGLFGPLTEGAVRQFQQMHDLVVDGVVGPRTREPLLVQPAAARRDRGDASRQAELKPPLPEPERAAPEPRDPPVALAVPPTPAPDADLRPEPASSSGISRWIAATLGALGAGLALGAALQASLRRSPRKRRPAVASAPASGRRPSLGMVCAALLAVFAAGAAVGALFVTHAADDGRAQAAEPRAAHVPARARSEGAVRVIAERQQPSRAASTARERLEQP